LVNDDHDEADPWGCGVSCKIVYDEKKNVYII